MAHEIGHALGMNHDFGPVGRYNNPNVHRFDIRGNTCTNIHGVMDYPAGDLDPMVEIRQKNKFTACSQEDYRQHYNEICEVCGEQCQSYCFECGKLLRCIEYETALVALY